MKTDGDLKPGMMNKLTHYLQETIRTFGQSGWAELMELHRRPGRLMYLNFIAGIARGFGIAIGFTLISAVVVALLVRLASLNLPIIGDFVASVAQAVQYRLVKGP